MPALGVARGFIEIGLSRLQSQRQVAVGMARDIGQGFERAFRSSASAVQSFSRQLDSMRGRLNSIRGELTALSVGGTALTGFGLRAADNLKVLQARFEAITGSEEEALKLMERIEAQARRFGQPVRETQTTFAGLAKQAEAAGDSVEDLVGIAGRLRILDPTARAVDVQIALREAFSGNFRSAQQRFELPSTREIQRLVDETGSVVKAFDIILDQMGVSEELAEEFGNSFNAAAENLRSTGQEILERAFTPHLQAAADTLNNINQALQAAPDALVEIGGSAVIATTGISGLLLVLSQVLNTIQNIKKAGVFEGLQNIARNPGVQRAAVGAGAIAVGAGIGVEVTRGIGRAVGDQRLANFDFGQAVEILKQGLFLLVNALIEGGRNIAQGFGLIVSAIQTIPDAFENFRGRIEIAFGGILTTLGDFIASIPGAGEAGAGVRQTGEALRAAGETRLNEAQLRATARFQTNEIAINQVFDDLQQGAARAFGLIESEATETAEAVEKLATEEDKRTQLLAVQEAIQERLNAQAVTAFKERLDFEQQYTELLREGTPEQVLDRVNALEREREAIEKMLPELQELAKTNEDAAEAADEYNQRLGVINEQTDRLGVALSVAIARAAETLDTEFVQKIAEIEAERAQALAEADKNFQQALSELDADVGKKRGELRDEQIEALEDYQEREQEIIEQHRERVLEIERKSRSDILDAAARLDAAGVFAAQQRRQEQLGEEAKKLEQEREKNGERLAEQREKLTEEAQQLVAYYNERRAEIDTANQAELQQIRSKFDGEIAATTSAYSAERQQLLSHLTQQNQLLQQAQNLARQIQQQGLAGVLSDVRGFVGNLLKSSSQLNQGSSGKTVGSATVGSAPSKAGGVGFSAFAFQTGGVARVRGSDEALAFVSNKERVLSPQQTASFDRLVNALTGSGSGSTLSPDNIQVDVSGVDSFEALISRVTRQVLGQLYEMRAGVLR